jgi:hypothetical protein
VDAVSALQRTQSPETAVYAADLTDVAVNSDPPGKLVIVFVLKSIDLFVRVSEELAVIPDELDPDPVGLYKELVSVW